MPKRRVRRIRRIRRVKDGSVAGTKTYQGVKRMYRRGQKGWLVKRVAVPSGWTKIKSKPTFMRKRRTFRKARFIGAPFPLPQNQST